MGDFPTILFDLFINCHNYEANEQIVGRVNYVISN